MMDILRRRKKWLWVIGGVLVIGVGLFAWMRSRAQAAQAEQTAEADVVTVFRGDLSADATASGRLVAQQEADLALEAEGVVETVFVEVGDAVQAGDPLLKLQTATLERAVAAAEQTLVIQQASLAKLRSGATASDIAAAEAAVASAQLNLDDLLAGPGEEEIRVQEARVAAAQAQVAAAQAGLNQSEQVGTQTEILEARRDLEEAREAYTRAEEAHRATYDCDWNAAAESFECEGGTKDEEEARVPAMQALADLRAAEERLNNLLSDENTVAARQAEVARAAAQRDAAQARLNLLLAGPTEAEIAAARARLAEAEANLEQLLTGPTEEEIAMAEAQVAQAQIGLEKAQNRLADATLGAPFDGVVTAVNFSAGERASGTAVALVNLASLEVVLDVDEIDIGAIEMGQPATIILESYPDVPLDSEVVRIAPQNSDDNSTLITYAVHLKLAETELPLRANMTANANLVTASREDVLLVPNRAINADRAAGTFSVNRIVDAETLETETVEITIGLRDDQFTQVTGGLDAGDELLVGDNIPRFGPGSDNGGPGNGGPPGGGPGGG